MEAIITFGKTYYYIFLALAVIVLSILCAVFTKRWEITVLAGLYAICEAAYQGLSYNALLYYVSMTLLFLFAVMIAASCDRWYVRILAALSVVVRVFRIYFYHNIALSEETALTASTVVHWSKSLVIVQMVLVIALIVCYMLYANHKKKRREQRAEKELKRAIEEEKIAPPDEQAEETFERIKREKVTFDVKIDK